MEPANSMARTKSKRSHKSRLQIQSTVQNIELLKVSATLAEDLV